MFAFLSPNLHRQNWIISAMKALGLKGNKEGICYGLVYMAIQASLVNQMTTFNNRLKTIKQLTPEQLLTLAIKARGGYELDLLSNLQDKDKGDPVVGKIYLSEKGEYVIRDSKGVIKTGTINRNTTQSKSSDFIDLSDLTHRLDDPKLKEDILNSSLGRHTKKILPTNMALQTNNDGINEVDLLAFLQGIDLYHQPQTYGADKKFSEIFEPNKAPTHQNAASVMPILQPVTLSKEEEKITSVFSALNNYSETELAGFLTQIEPCIDKSESPISFKLSANGHAINLSYFPLGKEWLLTDPNNLPSISFKNHTKLSKKIFQNLTFGSQLNARLILQVNCYATQKTAEQLPELKEPQHPMFKLKSNDLAYTDENGFNLLSKAIMYNYPETVKKILQLPGYNCPEKLNIPAGKDPQGNQKFEELSPLMYSVQLNANETAELFLPKKQSEEKNLLLASITAAKNKNIDLFQRINQNYTNYLPEDKKESKLLPHTLMYLIENKDKDSLHFMLNNLTLSPSLLGTLCFFAAKTLKEKEDIDLIEALINKVLAVDKKIYLSDFKPGIKGDFFEYILNKYLHHFPEDQKKICMTIFAALGQLNKIYNNLQDSHKKNDGDPLNNEHQSFIKNMTTCLSALGQDFIGNKSKFPNGDIGEQQALNNITLEQVPSLNKTALAYIDQLEKYSESLLSDYANEMSKISDGQDFNQSTSRSYQKKMDILKTSLEEKYNIINDFFIKALPNLLQELLPEQEKIYSQLSKDVQLSSESLKGKLDSIKERAEQFETVLNKRAQLTERKEQVKEMISLIKKEAQFWKDKQTSDQCSLLLESLDCNSAELVGVEATCSAWKTSMLSPQMRQMCDLVKALENKTTFFGKDLNAQKLADQIRGAINQLTFKQKANAIDSVTAKHQNILQQTDYALLRAHGIYRNTDGVLAPTTSSNALAKQQEVKKQIYEVKKEHDRQESPSENKL